MWLFLPIGFFSVVAYMPEGLVSRHQHAFPYPSLTRQLLIRSRARQDLERLLEKLRQVSKRLERVKIIATPDADYPYRAIVERRLFAKLLTQFVTDELTYPNFKVEAAKQRHWVGPLHEVWEVMRKHEDEEAHRARGKLGA